MFRRTSGVKATFINSGKTQHAVANCRPGGARQRSLMLLIMKSAAFPLTVVMEFGVMRIIAGERRGHRIEGPADRDTRPTSDMVREAVFDILAGAIEDSVVLDVFAGTGAVGLEALSRGAARAIFVEKYVSNAALIGRNLATLRYEDRGAVLAMDAFRWSQAFRPIDDRPLIVFIDPPWRYYEQRSKSLHALIETVVSRLPAGSMIVVETRRSFDAEVLPDPQIWDLRRYGGTQIGIRGIAVEATKPSSEGEASDVRA